MENKKERDIRYCACTRCGVRNFSVDPVLLCDNCLGGMTLDTQKKAYDFLLSLVPNYDKNIKITTDEEKEKWISKELEKEFPFINFFHDDCYKLEDFEIEEFKIKIFREFEIIQMIKDEIEFSIGHVDFLESIIKEKEAKLKYFDYVLEGRGYDN